MGLDERCRGVRRLVPQFWQSGRDDDLPFDGNQVRLFGKVGPEGGWADAFMDGVQEPTRVECWNPTVREKQPIFLKKGLSTGSHELRIVVRGEKNPLAGGARVCVDCRPVLCG